MQRLRKKYYNINNSYKTDAYAFKADNALKSIAEKYHVSVAELNTLNQYLAFAHDLSRSHSRLGLGAEYQRDFLKGAANAYMHLSNWKDSPDFDNYEERPANRWDICTEGYLSAYPGIGGKLVYEQYYSDHCMGKSNQKRYPLWHRSELRPRCTAQSAVGKQYASCNLVANSYDFVDRNNNIVLEYRKKDTISLRLASLRKSAATAAKANKKSCVSSQE